MNNVTALPFASWPAGRKIAAVVFALAAYVALAVAAIYLSGALFLLLCKASPTQTRLGSIVSYWRLYKDDPLLRKRLQIAMGVSGVGLLVLLPAGMVIAARSRRPLHGDARFATPAEVERAGL
ncbi:MAG: type IV secretory system conjugative DNA transfer family protein, partial [Massilia sp.]